MEDSYARAGKACVRTAIAFPLPGGRCPRRGRMRVGIVGCGGHRTGGWGHPPLRRVTIDFVGAAVPSGPSITGAPPWSPSSVMAAPCHLLPCGAKALACIFRDAQMSMAFPSSVTAYAVPPSPRGRLFVSYPRGGCRGGYQPPALCRFAVPHDQAPLSKEAGTAKP